jgi:hypothetical protein
MSDISVVSPALLEQLVALLAPAASTSDFGAMLVRTGLEPPTTNGEPSKPAMLYNALAEAQIVAATGEPVYAFVEVVLKQVAAFDFEAVDQKQLHADLNVVLNITGWEIDKDGRLHPRSAVQQMAFS